MILETTKISDVTRQRLGYKKRKKKKNTVISYINKMARTKQTARK